MISHHMTSIWRQRFLQQISLMMCKQIWAHKCSHYLTAYPAFVLSQKFSFSSSYVYQTHHPKSSTQNYQTYKTAHTKDNSDRQKEAVMAKSFYTKETESKSGNSRISKPNQEKLRWLKSIHGLLMKSVVLPSEKKDAAVSRQDPKESLSTHDLMSMTMSIRFVDKETMKVIVALWRRFDSMSLEEILTIADIFFYNGVHAPWYTSAMITYIDETFGSLSFTPIQLTRLTFHISSHGSAPPSLLNGIEKTLCKNLSEFDILLVAFICQLHFVGKNRIKNPILADKIARKLLENQKSLNKLNLSMLMKMLRYSNYIKISFYKEFGDRLVVSDYFKQLQNLSQGMHIAYTYASVRVSHPQLFHSILVQCQQHDNSHRLKDIAKIMWACGTLVTNQEENISCIHNILCHLKKNITMKQVKEYPDNLVDMLMGLVLLNIYPHHFINMVFDPVILKILFGLSPDREKFFQLMFLDHSISIECPDYSGFRLTEADHMKVAQYVTNKSIEIDMQLRKTVKPAVAALENVLGSDRLQCQFVLPHCRTSDIFLSYDVSKKLFVKPTAKPLIPSRSVAERVFNKTTQDIVLLLLSRMQTTFDGQPLGLLHCKIRQLKALGYTVITIDAEEALLYTCLDREATQKLLFAHLSTHLDTDISKYLPSS